MLLVEIIKPAPDSHYRLVPCKCGGEPLYEHFMDEPIPIDHWGVRCNSCGKTTEKFYKAQHDAQIEWNTANKA